MYLNYFYYLLFSFIGIFGFHANVYSSEQECVGIVLPDNLNDDITEIASVLVDNLSKIYINNDFRICKGRISSKSIYLAISNRADNKILKPESYQICSSIHEGEERLSIIGADLRGLLYGVYSFIESIGGRFFLSDTHLPLIKEKINLQGHSFTDAPIFGMRILFNWHNFLSGCTGWNLDEYKQWIDGAIQQKYNAIMVHAYGNNPMFRFSFNDIAKETGYIASTVRGRDWGVEHVNDVQNLYGGEIFRDSIFGAEVSRVPVKYKEQAAVDLMNKAFQYAKEQSLDVIFSFDIATESSNPQNIINSLPSSACLMNIKGQLLVNPETTEGYSYYKNQVISLLKDYPMLDYLVPWVRCKSYPSKGDYLTVQEMPENWLLEYKTIIKSASVLKDDGATRSFFFLGKILKAYQKALKELNRMDVKLGLGTWNWVSFPYLDHFIGKDVDFFPIDYYVNYGSRTASEQLSEIRKERVVYPIVWAHHDDHSYIGRPYTPPSHFASQLQKDNCDGFGVLHWTTFPLDVYIRNVSEQSWERSVNKLYSETVADYGRSLAPNKIDFHKYLQFFYAEAPHFGRETTDFFFNVGLSKVKHTSYPKYEPEPILNLAYERLSLLEQIGKRDSLFAATNHYLYYHAMEEFFISFFTNQKKLMEVIDLMDRQLYEQAYQTANELNPEQTIKCYLNAIQHGPNTLGEQAIIISLNLKWLPDFIDIRQKVGIEPIRYSFGPTSHEYLAQSPGKYTYDVDRNKLFWVRLGEKEINEGEVSSQPWNGLVIKDVMSEFGVGYWRKDDDLRFGDVWKDNRLLSGFYILELHLKTEGDKDLYLQLKDDQGGHLYSGKHRLSNGIVTVPFQIKQPTCLQVGLKSNSSGNAISLTHLVLRVND